MYTLPTLVNAVLSAAAAGIFAGIAYTFRKREQYGRATVTAVVALLNTLAFISFVSEL